MGYLILFYAMGTALAIVIELIARAYIPAFIIAFLSCAAYFGGYHLRASFSTRKIGRKLGRFLYSAILIATSLYLAQHQTLDLYLYSVPGMYWSAAGILLGFLSLLTLPNRTR